MGRPWSQNQRISLARRFADGFIASIAMHAKVFISHASTDTWVARQLALQIEACGAETFLDAADIQHGDDFDEKLRDAADTSSEQLVLLTPWAMNRPYVWLEIGAFWIAKKRIVVVLHGLTRDDVAASKFLPVALKRLDFVNLNDIDSYFHQLKERIDSSSTHA